MTAPNGVLLVDKPQGVTSHTVVAMARRLLGTRKIGHAGTLDPMATGLLVLGVGPATRLLTFLVGLDKTYEATIALGATTVTDDAEGDVLATADASALAHEAVVAAAARLTGDIEQVPSAVSAIKVDGRRSYARVRAGEDVALAARPVTVSRFDLGPLRPGVVAIVADVVDCTSGTYVRALARDLGDDLGVGGHLSALRRTRVGPFDLADAVVVDDIAPGVLLRPVDVAARVLPVVELDDEDARLLAHGRRPRTDAEGVVAAVHAGELVGIARGEGGRLHPVANLGVAAADAAAREVGA
ncbi:tRNA pseudouridine(55) synthase TruB [Agrococcus versicolor]